MNIALHSICGSGVFRLESFVDRLGQILFPNNPKWVRHRKLRLLYSVVLLGLLTCAVAGMIAYFLGKPGF